MIAADVQSFALENLPVNWFDVAVLGLLILGLFRGRKHGMSKEILPLLKWLTLVLVSGFYYPMAAQLLVNTARWGKFASCFFGYLLLAFAIWILFLIFKRLLGYRLGENNFFGSGEYYLGMVSGMVRFACMLLAVLALLNAPYYTQADIQAHEAYTKRWFGGGLYSGNYFPDLATVQESVFKKSFTGPYIKDYLGPLLIETAPPSAVKPQPKPAVVNIQK
jgi:uncharacterized membrane protein required for colicin V production